MIASGILTKGLGGNHSSLILGWHHLGFELIIEELILTGGVGRAYSSFDGGGGVVPEDQKEVKITIKYNDKEWKKIYIRGKHKSKIIIKILKTIIAITTNITIKVRNFRKLLNKIIVKRK